MDKLLIIDGHALVFKMYYAFLRRPMINSKGEDMSILYGFTKYILELLEREKPSHFAVAFDPPGGSFRNEMYPQYKANRPPTPELVVNALEPLREIVSAMNVPVVMMSGFEADDVIGSIATQFSGEALQVCMLSPDKDYGQLISEHVLQYKPGNGGADISIIGPHELCEKWGISKPSQVIDMLAICGDAADNVPGVKGVGEVGAARLIAKYGSLEGIYEHLGELSAKQQQMFLEARPHISLSKELVTIKTDIPLPVTPEDMRYSGVFQGKIAELFSRYEFSSLRRFIAGKTEAAAPEQGAASAPALAEFSVREVPLATLAGRIGDGVGVVVRAFAEGVFSPVKEVILSDGEVAAKASALEARPILEDPAVTKYGDDLKKASNLLLNEGISLNGKWADVRLMHYVRDPEKSHIPEELAKTLLGIDIHREEEAAPASLFDDVPEEEDTAISEAGMLILLGKELEKGLPSLYYSMEEPLAKVLAKMERNGVKVDVAQLARFADSLRTELAERERRIKEMAGKQDFNISSPKQVGDLLFGEMKLDPKAKPSARGQYSTDEATLLEISAKHPIVNEILEYRAVKKLLSTYIEPFPSYVSEVDGRVHTTFNQALTATGRLSSSNPNLQNIPVRTERGKEIRKAFIPGTPDGVIVSADYSQIELRIMAHLSGDRHLVKAFQDGEDVHAATAAKIFGIPGSEVTREQRGMAKTANFGIMYGISSFGLAQRLHLGRKEAKALIDGYFQSFPAIREYIDGCVEGARRNGWVATLFGRRRYLPDINSRNANIRALAERNAVNAPIQGTSADIIKLAMVGVDRKMAQRGLKSKMVLQIHDELLFDAVPSEIEELREIVVEVMENVIRLSIPLTVECSHGKNWLEAH